MGEYQPLYLSLFIILIIGVVLPVFMGAIIQEPQPDDINSLVTGIIELVDNGVTFDLGTIIGTFNVNPFNILGTTLKGSLINYLTAFGYIPLWLLIPLLIIITIGIFYTVIKLLPTT
jgi:hypothetical protein